MVCSVYQHQNRGGFSPFLKPGCDREDKYLVCLYQVMIQHADCRLEDGLSSLSLNNEEPSG